MCTCLLIMMLPQFSCYLEYANSVWNSHHIREIKALEQVQMMAIKILASVKNSGSVVQA